MRQSSHQNTFLAFALATFGTALSGCGSGLVAAALAADGGDDPPPPVPQVFVMEAIGNDFPAVTEGMEDIPTNRPMEIRFSVPMDLASLRQSVVLETPREPDLASIAGLSDSEFMPDAFYKLEPRSGNTYALILRREYLDQELLRIEGLLDLLVRRRKLPRRNLRSDF